VDFLTGSLAELKATWTKYGIAVQIENDQIDHTPALFVIDQQGRERKLYLTQMAYSSVGSPPRCSRRRSPACCPGTPRWPASSRSRPSPGRALGSPHAAVRRPAGRHRSRSGRQPRLVMFFATWLSEVANLKSELTGMNAYVAAARRAGLPSLTAVDETVVEPSAQAVRTYLAGLGTKLDFPVGLDYHRPGGRRLPGPGPALVRPGLRVRQDHLVARRLAPDGRPGSRRQAARGVIPSPAR
jgi:Uncharacterized protein SCO1/SenC/PrrC, involved in biogenesis of respiratory and photosynthetic systems